MAGCYQTFCQDELPFKHTIDAVLVLWSQLWSGKWAEQLQKLKQQHTEITGGDLRITPSEENALKVATVPNTIASTLLATAKAIFPNVHYLITLLAVLPVTTCEAERAISSLRRLKAYLRSSVGEDRLTGLALMHIHRVNVDDIVTNFAIMHPHRMQLTNILKD